MTFVWPTQIIQPVRLPRKNASRGQVDDVLAFTDAPIPAGVALSSPYLEVAYQGVDMRPRAFCIVEPSPQAAVLDRERPFVRSSVAAVEAAKAQWQDVSISGRVEAKYLYATSLSVEPYRLGDLRLAALPVTLAAGGMFDVLRQEQVLARGDAGMAGWIADCEREFAAKLEAAERERFGTVVDYINTQGKLAAHTPKAHRVVWGKGGANVRAVVVPDDIDEVLGLPVGGFVVDLNQYFVTCETPDEAHYLCAVLNTDRVNDAIKAVQTLGQQGPRDIHRRPLEEVPIPRYDAEDPRHTELADVSREAHAVAPGVQASSARARQHYLHEIGEPVVRAEALTALVIDEAIAART